jgi:hypothetical protein
MAVTKSHVLNQIRRIAQQDGGRPPGIERFVKLTGIRRSDFLGVHWARWRDSLRDAGFEPNELNMPIDQSLLLEKYIKFARELGRLPVANELRMRARSDSDFPNHTIWNRRFGSKADLVTGLREYCEGRTGCEDIIALCDAYQRSAPRRTQPKPGQGRKGRGYVYLMQSGARYKLGRANSVGRRQRQLQTGSPDPLPVLHYIETDDPSGIERYWHERFADKRVSGEWFELSPTDVADFRRRKSM